MRTSEADRSTRSISEPSPGRLHSSIRRKSSCDWIAVASDVLSLCGTSALSRPLHHCQSFFFQPLQAAKQCTRSWKSGAIPMHAIYQCYYWTRLICCVTQTTTVGDLRKRQYVAGQWTMASTGFQDVMSALTRTGLYRSRRLANMSLHCAARRYQTPRA